MVSQALRNQEDANQGKRKKASERGDNLRRAPMGGGEGIGKGGTEGSTWGIGSG